MNKTIDEIIKKAKEADSYFAAITIKDENKTEGDLTHYAFQHKFPLDNIIPSLDSCVRSMGVKIEKPVEITVPPKVDYKDKKPLKIAPQRFNILILLD